MRCLSRLIFVETFVGVIPNISAISFCGLPSRYNSSKARSNGGSAAMNRRSRSIRSIRPASDDGVEPLSCSSCSKGANTLRCRASLRTKLIATLSAMRYIHVENGRVASYFGHALQIWAEISCARSSRSSARQQYVLTVLKMIPLCDSRSASKSVWFSLIALRLSLTRECTEFSTVESINV